MLKAYASYFISFLLKNFTEAANIHRIVLYGSAARDQARQDSDIDIFVETSDISVAKKIKKIEQQFYESREAILFKSSGIDNKFSIKVGSLKDWQDLYRSIASTGIVLYGPFQATNLPSGTKQMVVIFWDNIGKNRGAFLNKIYGVKIHDKKYPGLLEKFNGKRIGKSSIMIPVEYQKDLFVLLKQYKVNAKHIEVFT